MEDDQIELQHKYERLKDTIEAKNEELISDKMKRIGVTTSTGQEVDMLDVPFWVDEKWNVHRSPMSGQFSRAHFTSAREYKILELQDIIRMLNNTILSMEVFETVAQKMMVSSKYNTEPISDKMKRIAKTSSFGQPVEEDVDLMSSFSESDTVFETVAQTMMVSSKYDTELISKKMERTAETTSFGQRIGEDVDLMSSFSESDTDSLDEPFWADELSILGSLTSDCGRCRMVHKLYRSSVKHIFIVHAKRSIIAGGKSPGKTRLMHQVGRNAAALLNTSGGEILFHLDGQQSGDTCLKYFDEFLSRIFQDLLWDSQLYTSAYSRDWLGNMRQPKLSTGDFVVLHVNKSQLVATTNINTKCQNYIEKYSSSPSLIMSILSQPVQETKKARIMGLSDNMYADHRTVLKTFRHNRSRDVGLSPLDYIWENLKLKEYITSMSKIPDGGSFFVGISTCDKKTYKHRISISVVEGFYISFPKEEIIRYLHGKLKTDMCVLEKATMGFQDVPSDLIDVALHPVLGGLTVLEVAIGFFDGIVFCNKYGPTTYKAENGRIYRMDRQEWLERLQIPDKSPC